MRHWKETVLSIAEKFYTMEYGAAPAKDPVRKRSRGSIATIAGLTNSSAEHG